MLNRFVLLAVLVTHLFETSLAGMVTKPSQSIPHSTVYHSVQTIPPGLVLGWKTMPKLSAFFRRQEARALGSALREPVQYRIYLPLRHPILVYQKGVNALFSKDHPFRADSKEMESVERYARWESALFKTTFFVYLLPQVAGILTLPTVSPLLFGQAVLEAIFLSVITATTFHIGDWAFQMMRSPDQRVFKMAEPSEWQKQITALFQELRRPELMDYEVMEEIGDQLAAVAEQGEEQATEIAKTLVQLLKKPDGQTSSAQDQSLLRTAIVIQKVLANASTATILKTNGVVDILLDQYQPLRKEFRFSLKPIVKCVLIILKQDPAPSHSVAHRMINVLKTEKLYEEIDTVACDLDTILQVRPETTKAFLASGVVEAFIDVSDTPGQSHHAYRAMARSLHALIALGRESAESVYEKKGIDLLLKLLKGVGRAEAGTEAVDALAAMASSGPREAEWVIEAGTLEAFQAGLSAGAYDENKFKVPVLQAMGAIWRQAPEEGQSIPSTAVDRFIEACQSRDRYEMAERARYLSILAGQDPALHDVLLNQLARRIHDLSEEEASFAALTLRTLHFGELVNEADVLSYRRGEVIAPSYIQRTGPHSAEDQKRLLSILPVMGRWQHTSLMQEAFETPSVPEPNLISAATSGLPHALGFPIVDGIYAVHPAIVWLHNWDVHRETISQADFSTRWEMGIYSYFFSSPYVAGFFKDGVAAMEAAWGAEAPYFAWYQSHGNALEIHAPQFAGTDRIHINQAGLVDALANGQENRVRYVFVHELFQRALTHLAPVHQLFLIENWDRARKNRDLMKIIRERFPHYIPLMSHTDFWHEFFAQLFFETNSSLEMTERGTVIGLGGAHDAFVETRNRLLEEIPFLGTLLHQAVQQANSVVKTLANHPVLTAA